MAHRSTERRPDTTAGPALPPMPPARAVPREAGNASVSRRLRLGPTGGACEQEAAAVASAVVAGGALPARPRGGASDAAVVQRAADAPATSLSPGVEAGIEAARGHGDPLESVLRGAMAERLCDPLTDVRVHTDGGAGALARAVGAQAFTTGSDVFFAPGRFAPATARGRGLLAHELTHVIQQRSGDPLVQRSVGYEFETGYAAREIERGRFRDKRKTLKKATILHAYQGFNLTADETSTEVGAALEWVVDPPVPEQAGVGTLDAIMQRLEVVANQIEALNGRQRFTLDEATGDPRDAWVEILPQTIPGAGPGMPSNPQVTAGIRQEQMQTLYRALGHPQGADAPLEARLNQVGGGLLLSAARSADTIDGSDELKGLVTQLIAYLKAGSLGLNPPSPGQSYKYAKLIGKIMARTDFGSQFLMLPNAERTYFAANPDRFEAMVLGAAGTALIPMPPDALVFERGIRKDATKTPTAMTDLYNFPVTRRDWLRTITTGRDRLSAKHMQQWKGELEGLGALGAKTDTLAGGRKGVIVEFRGVSAAMPLAQWRQFATDTFDYISRLNAGLSPEERELQEFFAGFDV